MFRSLGNIRVNPRVGLLFIDLERPKRLRVNGVASIHEKDPLIEEFTGAQHIVRVTVAHVFPNCPRYIHRWQLVEHSMHVPQPDRAPPVPDWKLQPDIVDSLPEDDPARRGDPE